jgi:carbon starvation protein CstA
VWITLLPTLFMLFMTLWSLGLSVQVHLSRLRTNTAAAVHHVEFVVVLVLFAMAVWLVVEAVLLARNRTPPGPLVPQPSAA